MGNVESSGSNTTTAFQSKKICSQLKSECLIREEKFGTYSSSLYNVNLKKEALHDHSRISIFKYDFDSVNSTSSKDTKDRVAFPLKLRTLRHPFVLKCLNVVVVPAPIVSNGTEPVHQVFLITEQVQPLDTETLERLTEPEVALGLYQLLQAMDFLHSRAGLAHCGISWRGAVFVSQEAEGADWRLGGGELLRPFIDLGPDSPAWLEKLKGEESQDNTIAWNGSRADAYDMLCFGRAALDILEISGCADPELLSLARVMAASCLHPDPCQRPTATKLLQHAAFVRQPFIQLYESLRGLTAMTTDQQKQFFYGLSDKLFSLPESLVASRLGRPLLSRVVIVQSLARTCLLPFLLHPYKGQKRPLDKQSLLSESHFKNYLSPLLALILEVRERTIRLALLEQFSGYCHLLERGNLQARILPELVNSLRDPHAPLVAATLKALGDLVPVLGTNVVLRPLSQAQLQLAKMTEKSSQMLPESGPRLNNSEVDLPPPESARPNAQPTLRDLAQLSGNYRPPGMLERKMSKPSEDEEEVPESNETDSEKLMKMVTTGDEEPEIEDAAQKRLERETKREERRRQVEERRQKRRQEAINTPSLPVELPVVNDIEDGDDKNEEVVVEEDGVAEVEKIEEETIEALEPMEEVISTTPLSGGWGWQDFDEDDGLREEEVLPPQDLVQPLSGAFSVPEAAQEPEEDFFADMEPTIQVTHKMNVQVESAKAKFAASDAHLEEEELEEGDWGD